MIVFHAAEAFSAGVAEFIKVLVEGLPMHKHVVCYGLREQKERGNLAEIIKKFPSNTIFVSWTDAQREIDIIKDVKALRFLIKSLTFYKPDILHLHSSKAGFIGRVAAKISGFKNVIYTPHGAPFLREDLSYTSKIIYISLEKFANYLSGCVIACSKSESDQYKKIGISSSYINNGVKILAYKNPVTKNINSSDVFNVINSGRTDFQKNPELFKEIYTKVSNLGFNFKWVGDGTFSQLLINAGIIVTGWKDNEEVNELVNTADCFLSTSRWEGLSISIIEAMCLRKPLLLKNCVGNVDLVRHGENGYLFNTIDEATEWLIYLKNNPEIKNKMGEKSFEIAKNMFNSEITVEKYNLVYQKNIQSTVLKV